MSYHWIAFGWFGVQRLRVRWSPSESDHESIVRSLKMIASEVDRLGVASAEVPKDTQELAESDGRRIPRRNSRDGNSQDELVPADRGGRRGLPSPRDQQPLRCEQCRLPDEWIRTADPHDRCTCGEGGGDGEERIAEPISSLG